MDKKKYTIPVTYEVCGTIEIEAESLEAALKQFEENNDNIKLPHETEYVDGSYQVSGDYEFVKDCYNNGKD